MKRRTAGALAALFLITFRLFCAENSADIYARAVKALNSYEMEKAMKLFERVLPAADADDKTKIRTAFWIASIHVSDGNDDAASLVFREMLKSGRALDLEVTSLPEEIYRNSELMSLFEAERRNVSRARDSIPKKVMKLLRSANRNYMNREFYDAEKDITLFLAEAPQNREGLELKEKIAESKSQRIAAMSMLVEEHFERAKGFAANGNLVEAMYELKSALLLNPKHQDSSMLFGDLERRITRQISSLLPKDKITMKKAVRLYLDDNFSAAAGRFKKLQHVLPNIGDYISFAVSHEFDRHNRVKARKYYRSALKARRNGRFMIARENLMLALALDKYSVDARVMLAEVNVEFKRTPQEEQEKK